MVGDINIYEAVSKLSETMGTFYFSQAYILGQKGLRILKTGVPLRTAPSISHPSSHPPSPLSNIDNPRFDTFSFE